MVVSDLQTEGTFLIPQLEQARAALSKTTVIRVVGCLPTAPWICLLRAAFGGKLATPFGDIARTLPQPREEKVQSEIHLGELAAESRKGTENNKCKQCSILLSGER
jgi:hypothetical protein